jgi:hypothetical protein
VAHEYQRTQSRTSTLRAGAKGGFGLPSSLPAHEGGGGEPSPSVPSPGVPSPGEGWRGAASRLSPTAGSTKWPMSLARDTGAIATGAGRVEPSPLALVGWGGSLLKDPPLGPAKKTPFSRKKAALRAAGARGGVGKKAGGAGGREAPGGSARF